MSIFYKLGKSGTLSIILSVLLGLGFSTMFRKICKGNNCVILKAPNSELLEKDIYYYPKKKDICVKFNEVAAPCNVNSILNG